jgi:hypothetical protein
MEPGMEIEIGTAAIGMEMAMAAPDPSRGAATYNSPGRKSWVKEKEGNKSRRDDTGLRAMISIPINH